MNPSFPPVSTNCRQQTVMSGRLQFGGTAGTSHRLQDWLMENQTGKNNWPQACQQEWRTKGRIKVKQFSSMASSKSASGLQKLSVPNHVQETAVGCTVATPAATHRGDKGCTLQVLPGETSHSQTDLSLCFLFPSVLFGCWLPQNSHHHESLFPRLSGEWGERKKRRGEARQNSSCSAHVF